ncbi:MAG: NYN domain-containing protein [Rhodospirillaceae bacterium]
MVYIFIDDSNIFFTAMNYIWPTMEGFQHETAGQFGINAAGLIDVVANGRHTWRCYVAGSNAPGRDQFWQHYRSAGAEVDVHQRDEHGCETTVDAAIQAKIIDVLNSQSTPGTIVLVTGDGNGFRDGKGFIPTLMAAHKRGWKFEVVAWDYGCNPTLREYATQFGIFRSLDPAFDQVTFVTQRPRRSFPRDSATARASLVPPNNAVSPFSLAARLTPATLAVADSLRHSDKTPSKPQHSPAKPGGKS